MIWIFKLKMTRKTLKASVVQENTSMTQRETAFTSMTLKATESINQNLEPEEVMAVAHQCKDVRAMLPIKLVVLA